MCFGTKTKSSSQQQSTQSGTSQSNLFDNPMFQSSMTGFFDQFSQPNIAQVTTGPNQYQTAAADALTAGLGSQGVTNQIATSGLTPEMIQAQMSPYIQAVVDPTIAAQHLQNSQALSSLRGRMGTRGSLGNNTGAEAAYLAGVQPGQQAVIGNLYNQGWQQAANTALQSIQSRLAASQQGTQGAGTLGQIGEMIRNAGLQGQMLPFQLTSQLSQSLAPWLQAAGVNFSGESSGTSSGTSTTSPGIGNVIAGLVGSWLASDPRLKENMREIGATHDGKPLYAFNFRPGLGMPTHTQIGLNAREVAATDPDAVAETPMGLMVNYDRVLPPFPAMNGGGAVGGGNDDAMAKVARAFNMIHGLKRKGRDMANGGMARPGYFLGGLTNWMFPAAQSLGTSAGGWQTSVQPASPLDFGGGSGSSGGPQTPMQKMGQGIMSMAQSMSDPGAGQQSMRQGQDALASQQQGLSAMLQSILGGGGGRNDGGRVGYDDGGETPWVERDPAPVLSPGLLPPESAPETPFWPMAGNYPYEATGALPPPPAPTMPALGAPPTAAAPAPAPWAPTVQREPAAPATAPAAAAESPTWWGTALQTLFPHHQNGIYRGEAMTPAQRAGVALMAMSGPMVAGPSANALLQMHKQDTEDREVRRQADQLRQQMAHQAAVLAETSRHNRAAEEQGNWIIDPARGVMINRRTGETREIGVDEFQRRRTAAVGLGMREGEPGFNEFVLTGRMRGQDLSPAQVTLLERYRANEVTHAQTLADLDRAVDINDSAYSGWGAEGRAGIVQNFGGSTAAADTQELARLMTGQMLSGLRATFGGNPTEGERRVLAEVEGSVNLPPDQRKKVLERARAMLQARMRHERNMIEAIEGRNFTRPQPPPQEPPPRRDSTEAPERPASVPVGSAWNPRRRLWRDPSGKIYKEDGSPVDG